MFPELEVRDLGGVVGGVVVRPERMLRLFIARSIPREGPDKSEV